MKSLLVISAALVSLAAPAAHAGTSGQVDAPGGADSTAAAPVAAVDAQDAARQRATTYRGSLKSAVRKVRLADEQRDGYDRDLFRHWVDADKNGCDARREVLLAEAVVAPSLTTGCTLTGGEWFSYFDAVTVTDSSTLDIDHLVPLAEAWDSGAYAWDAATRERFANDLDDPRSLIAVTASSNRSKSDQAPNEWLPVADAVCRYVTEWVAVKIRWSLTAETAERDTLRTLAADCPKTKVKVTRAAITLGPSSPEPDPGTPDPVQAGTVVIAAIVYDPTGSDTAATANEEQVTLRNPGSEPVSLKGWTLTDAAGHSYLLPGVTLAGGASMVVHSGEGTNSTGTVSAGTTGRLYADWGHVWNNSGDTAVLKRADNTTSDSVTYPGGGTGRVEY